jgi:LysM repeat protein
LIAVQAPLTTDPHSTLSPEGLSLPELEDKDIRMAVDLRVSNKSSCRRWLESTLISLEQRRVLEATRERRPPHYHVALYPETYLTYVDKLTPSPVKVAAATSAPAATGGPSATSDVLDYRVNRGDSLWSIARQHGTTVEELKDMNGLRSSRIAAGQVLTVPASSQQQ